MFLPLFAALFGYVLLLGVLRGPREALWHGWILALLLAPTWLVRGVGSVQLDLRTAAACGALAAFMFFGTRERLTKWVWADALVFLLVVFQIVSQWMANDLRPLTPFEIARKWWLPYLMGRLFFGSGKDVQRVLPIVAALCVVLSVYAVGEAISKINPVNKLLGKTFALLEQGEGYRWGLKRAQGFVDHPIFFGNLLVLIFPWSMEAARQSGKPSGQRWWRIAPWLMGAAIFVTVSRGPQLAALFTLFATFFFRYPSLRPGLLAGILIAGLAAYGLRDEIQGALEQLAGEKEEETRIIKIDGEDEEYTGTRHRLLLFKVYRKYLESAGLFGFGYRMEKVELDNETSQRFASIDNHYMLFYLQHGALAIGTFGILALCSLWYLGRVAWDVSRPESGLAATLFGSMLGVDLLLTTVWFAPDFGSVWLFCAGLAANIRTLPAESDREQPKPGPATGRQTEGVPRRLVAGHAPVRGQMRVERNG